MRKLYRNFKWGFDGEPQTLLVENGRVIFREPEGLTPPAIDCEEIDLGGKFLLPSFIDPHCHILPTGLDLQKLTLSGCESHDEVLERLRTRIDEIDDGEWLLAIHYDQTRFPEGEHITRTQLDKISPNRPILLRHVNGHAGVANTACLERAGVAETTPDPKGGQFVRDASGGLTGVLLEQANEMVWGSVKTPTLEQMVDAIMLAGDKMAEYGIACASDMMTGRFDLNLELQAYGIAAERGCKIRTRLYLMWATLFGPRAFPRRMVEDLEHSLPSDRCCVSGVKIFADGAIGSATAAIYGRYESSTQPETETFVDGQLIYSQDRLRQMVRVAHEAGYRIAIHSIGDHSTDMVMEAYSELDDASRHRIEHAMILSDSQIETMEKLRLHCCMQPEFLIRFAHSYKRQLGPERASRLNRYRSVHEAAIPLSFSSDRPIVQGNPWDGIRAAESRPEGYDQNEKLTRAEALYAYTAMGAVANGEGAQMGWLQPGHFADFQLYDNDPMVEAKPSLLNRTKSGTNGTKE
jgi:hypothetical protein